jgi:hypothetical protein
MRPSRGKGGRVRRAVVLGDELSSMGVWGSMRAKIGAPDHGPAARAMTHLGDVVFRHVCTHKAHIRACRGYVVP